MNGWSSRACSSPRRNNRAKEEDKSADITVKVVKHGIVIFEASYHRVNYKLNYDESFVEVIITDIFDGRMKTHTFFNATVLILEE